MIALEMTQRIKAHNYAVFSNILYKRNLLILTTKDKKYNKPSCPRLLNTVNVYRLKLKPNKKSVIFTERRVFTVFPAIECLILKNGFP